MAKKIEIDENWNPVEVEDLDNLFIVVFKHGSFDQGYIEAFDTDDVLMQSAYDSLAKQYDDCGCDELTKIYLIKVPNTDQTVNMCNTGLFNGNSCDPHVIEATRDLFNRADCEHLSCWEGHGLTEAKKKKNKNIIPGGYLTITTGDPALNIKHFNKRMGTDGLGNAEDHPHLVVGDTLPDGPVASKNSGEASGDAGSSAGEGGAVGESLTEAHLDYSTQLSKMRQLEAGTRGFNAGSASLEKILFNYDICISHNMPKARKVMEDALRLHGWDSYIKPSKLKADYIIIDASGVDIADAKFVDLNKNNAEAILDNRWANIIIYLLIALFSGNNTLATEIKDGILKNYDITLTQLKSLLAANIADKNLVARLKAVCAAINESLNEDTFYSHHLEGSFELPPEIKLLNKDDVEAFVSKLSPEELFEVGYVSPVYFYKELDTLFTLIKTTQLQGYTGLDYRDATGDANVADHADRLANAQRQIDTYKDGAEGHQLNKEGEKFSAKYKQTNKLTLNQKKDNAYNYEYEQEVDDQGNPKVDANGLPVYKKDDEGKLVVKSKIDLSKILFYPKVGSKPKVTYFLDLKDGKGFRKVKRELLEDTLYKKIMEMAFAKDNQLSSDDLKKIKKLGFKDIFEFQEKYKGLSLKDVLDAYKANMDPFDYVKQYPYSRRWTMKDFSGKINKMLEQDAATAEAQQLDAATGMDRNVEKQELKPQVRALYTNQIYYLSGKPGTFGNVITEGLEENVKLDEAKRYVKRYYVRPLNIFCGNKEDIIQALIRAGDQNCSVYSLKNLNDHEDVHLLQPSDIIYYWDDRVLYDKNHVQVMDYDLFVKHEEERKKVGNVDMMSDAAFSDMYDDRATESDLKNKEVIANYKALNKITR